ncbi:ras-interacting protein RIP3 [Scaptodrosophila lebanonensis]|uniref:Ras-interacting protein RIP3 n=1 Tax=Drosophila lebanonensis TaxID=7225 RepID=A0A6J2TCZ5_DROLE|nr:ras-interacting protein RIP3 [Scaptodrosophila lebanonensis]
MDVNSLIAEVKNRPALWDATHPDHANRNETLRLWNSVAETLGVHADICRSKWKNLRCSYRRQQHRRSSQSKNTWVYAEPMCFLDGQRLQTDSSKEEEEDCDATLAEGMSDYQESPMPLKIELLPSDEMEADNDALMKEFQSVATPQALRRLSHSISLASAAAEEQDSKPAIPMAAPIVPDTAMSVAASSSCHCAKRVDEQVHFLEDLEREEQKLMQSTNQDISRCKNVLHVGDSDYNYLISFLPLMKQMSPLQNVGFRAKMGELLLQTMAAGPIGVQQQQQQLQQQAQQQQQQQQQQMQQQTQQQQQLQQQQQQQQQQQEEQQMALDQEQVSTSSTNWN